MAMKSVIVLALAAFAPSSAVVLVHQKAFLGSAMQPDVVARTLSNVEDEWKAQAAVFAECNSTTGLEGATIVNCEDAPASFDKSCETVVKAIVQGSDGDKAVAKEYMADVCGQSLLSGWHQEQCGSLAVALEHAMTADKYENRESFNVRKVCTGFWTQFLSQEQERLQKEKAEQEAAEKKAAEEAAEKERQEQEEAKKEAERKEAEQAARVKQEAEAKAAEAKAKAAEAAAKAEEKKAEAAAVAEAAKQKMAEAQAAEDAHQKAIAQADGNATVADSAAATTVAPEAANHTEPATEPVNATEQTTETSANATASEKPAEAKA